MTTLRRILRILSWSLAGLWLTLVLVWLVPAFRDWRVDTQEIETYASYKASRQSAQREFKPPFQRMKILRLGEEIVTPLVFVPYQYVIEGLPSQPSLRVEPRPSRLMVRYDRLVGSLAMGVILFLLGFPWNGKSAQPSQRPVAASIKELVSFEISHCEDQCRYVSKRASLMLWLGAMVAAGGIGAIYFLFPWRVEGHVEGEKLLLIRSFALVFYIEALAFLLLRQYRLAQEDYAYFNGIRTRCVHFLSVLLAIETRNADVTTWFTSTLSSEDPHYGRSKKPEAGKGKGDGAQPDAGGGGDSNPLQVALLTTLKDLLEAKKGS